MSSSPPPATGAERTGDGASSADRTRVEAGTYDGRGRPGGMVAARRTQWLIFGGLAAGILVVDQLIKAWVVTTYQVGTVSPILDDSVRIWLSHNTGALFGMFRDQAALFALFSLGVIGIILWYQAKGGGSLIVSVALGLLLGGALGNLSDRLRLGYVLDFMDLGIGTWRWYTFNVADAAISGAVLLLLLMALVPALTAAGTVRDA